MKKEHLLVLFIIMLVIIPFGCKKKETSETSSEYTELDDVNGFRCSDGRLVTDGKYCLDAVVEERMAIDPADPDLEIEAEKVSVGKTGFIVSTAQDAEDAFEGYVKRKDLDYKVVSAEEIEPEGGVRYYRVRYSHNEKSGGRRNMIVDSNGNVFQEVGLA